MSQFGLMLLVIVVVILIGGSGIGYNRGYWSGTPAPSYYHPGLGLFGILLVVVVILLLMGRI